MNAQYLVGKTIARAELNHWKLRLEFTDGKAIEVKQAHDERGSDCIRVTESMAKTEYQRLTEDLGSTDMSAMLHWFHTNNLAPTLENIQKWRNENNRPYQF